MSSAALQPPREPKYYTVKRHLLAIIESLEPDSAVPTERVLAAELGTSRTTVRQALLELVAEGRLVRRSQYASMARNAGIPMGTTRSFFPLPRTRTNCSFQ